MHWKRRIRSEFVTAFIVPSVFPSSPTCLHPETPPFTFKDPLLISLGGEKPNSLTNWISIFCSCWITVRLFFSLLDLRVFRLSELRSAKIHQDEIKLLCKEENENVNVSVVGRKTNDLLIFTNPVRWRNCQCWEELTMWSNVTLLPVSLSPGWYFGGSCWIQM